VSVILAPIFANQVVQLVLIRVRQLLAPVILIVVLVRLLGAVAPPPVLQFTYAPN
jgi:hypothetical protein